MTQNRRIFLNIVATYGRSLYALAVGLFCGRWALMSLGEVDYGLMGVVGGLTAFITLLNGIMASGVGRFYAISVGEERIDPAVGLEKCQEWFTAAVLIHSLLPSVLMLMGYPAGEWAVRSFLSIPPDRIDSCIWLWRFTCVSCFVGMASVPYHGMYGAKQEIAELTIYSFITTTLNFMFLYYMISHPGDWLVRYGLWVMSLSVVPSLVITARAFVKYKECRFRMKYIKCWKRIREMLSYSAWLVIGSVAELFSRQGVSIFINKIFGPRVNAASAIGTTLSGHCETLSGSMIGAFCPAIMNAYGAGDMVMVKKYAERVSKLAMIFIMVFAIPLALEVDEVLHLWLKVPPQYTAGLCVCGLVYMMIDKLSWGDCIAVYATGKVALYQVVIGGIHLCILPVAWVMYESGLGVYSAAVALICLRVFVIVLRPIFTRKLLGFSFVRWVKHVLVPICITGGIGLACGVWPQRFFEPSFLRIVLTTCAVDLPMVLVAWFLVMNADERQYLTASVLKRLRLSGK